MPRQLLDVARTSSIVVTPASTFSMPSWRSVRMPSPIAWCWICSERAPCWISWRTPLLTVSKGVRSLIQQGARSEQIQHHAMGEGMRTLRQDGIEKVLAGVTTIEEVRATSNN